MKRTQNQDNDEFGVHVLISLSEETDVANCDVNKTKKATQKIWNERMKTWKKRRQKQCYFYILILLNNETGSQKCSILPVGIDLNKSERKTRQITNSNNGHQSPMSNLSGLFNFFFLQARPLTFRQLQIRKEITKCWDSSSLHNLKKIKINKNILFIKFIKNHLDK